MKATLLGMCIGLAGVAPAPCADPAPAERWAVPSWGDVVCVYGPGTDASMDSPEAMERTFKRWMARGMTGVTLRTDLADYEPMIHRNQSTRQNPRLQLLLDYVDRVSARFNVIEAAEKIGGPLGFKVWAWHPHLYSDGAPSDVGTPGLGRMIPWSYVSRYFLDHPEGVTIDRKGNKLWMVREYAYPEARASKVSEFVHMAKAHGIKRFIACMRSEVNQLVDPPERGDQYGFNAPVVEEMKRRHGVDILADARFDVFSADFKIDDPMVEHWRKLRGEHITQFYRELRAALRAVDPQIQIAVTLSGEYAGPPLGNQRLDWRTWVEEGLIDAIIAPVFFEATLDHEASKKGYLTRSRDGVGTAPAAVIKDFIKQSKHPEVAVMATGAMPYFNQPPPSGADGWRTDVWYELYTSAWAQRWSQWMKDVKELGGIAFLDQNFDSFPTDPRQLPPAGSLGTIAYDPKLRACPGGWYPFGDDASGKAVVQEKIRRGDTGRAVRLTSNGAAGPSFIGYHASDADRSNISAVLDTSITSGKCEYSFWVYRESETSGAVACLENRGGELDVGLRVEPVTGIVSYTTGRSPGGTGTWKPTSHRAPVGEWQRYGIRVDFVKACYSAFAGVNADVVLAEGIPYTPPAPRTTMQNGVNIEIPVPSYKAFRQVLFQPLGPAGSKVYLDDVLVSWVPAPEFTPDGTEMLFVDDFESYRSGADGLGQKWVAATSEGEAFQVISSTSYREGVKSLLAARGGDLRPMLARAIALRSDDILTFDADCFIRSEAPVASILPGQMVTSKNEFAIVIEPADGEGRPLAMAEARRGKWLLQGNGPGEEAPVPVPYDCWMRVQVAVNMKTRACTFVQQQIGQVPQKLGTGLLPENVQAGQPLSFRIRLGAANTCVVMDNVRITRASASAKN
jgi:hypothetical protein